MCPIFIRFAKVFFWLPFLFQKKSNLLASLFDSNLTATVIQQPLGCLTIGVVTCAEHIVCVFPENIISRFDVSVNDVARELAEKLRLKF